MADSGGEVQWYFSQVKGTMEDEVNEADVISTVEFNDDGELLATGDKGGRIVIFQREQPSKTHLQNNYNTNNLNNNFIRSEYNVYSTFQSHEAEFDYLKSLEIEEKINKIKWLKRKNIAHFLLSTNDKTVKLWKIRERNKRAISSESTSISSYSSSNKYSSNQMLNGGVGDQHVSIRDDTNGFIRTVSIPVIKYMDRIEVEAIPKRIFANAHAYHINSISLNSDQETFMSADDLRINLWHIEITNQSFNIVDIKPANMEELTEVITAAEFHPKECNLFVYSSSKGIIRLCDMRQSALCDTQAKIFEEREDPTTKNFFSEIISSISDVKFSHSGRYLCTRDYLHVKVWDLNMENRPLETYCVHDYLRNKLCALYENDCIFDKFECSWSSNDDHILSGSYNNFFKSFNRSTKQELMFECSREQSKPRQLLKPKRVINANLTNGQNTTATTTGSQNNNINASPSLNAKRTNAINGNGTKSSSYKDEVNVDNLDFTKKILHTSWHPKDNIIAIAATNNLYLFYNKENNYNNNSLSSSSNSSSCTTSNNSSLNGGTPFNNQHTSNNSSSFIIGTNGINENINPNNTTNFNQINQSQQQSLPLPLNQSTITLTPVIQSSTLPDSSAAIAAAQTVITNEAIQNCNTTNNISTANSTNINNSQITLNTSFYTATSSNTSSTSSTPVPVVLVGSNLQTMSITPVASVGVGGGSNATSMSL